MKNSEAWNGKWVCGAEEVSWDGWVDGRGGGTGSSGGEGGVTGPPVS